MIFRVGNKEENAARNLERIIMTGDVIAIKDTRLSENGSALAFTGKFQILKLR